MQPMPRGLVLLALASLSLACGSVVNPDEEAAAGAGSGPSVASSGATTGGDVEPCAPRDPRITNIQAMELVACRGVVPASARLKSCRSSRSGELGADGRDDDWILWFNDDAARQVISARVTGGEVEVSPQATDDSCGAPLTLLDSAAILPDAVHRLAGVDTIEGGYTNWFIDEALDCSGPAALEGHSVQVERLSEDQATYHTWFFYYRPDGAAASVCGPCDTPSEDACGC